jgi:hypothetical protein
MQKKTQDFELSKVLDFLKIFEISTLLKKNPLKMSEFLKNKYFFNENSPSYILIPENDNFVKGKNSFFCQNS